MLALVVGLAVIAPIQGASGRVAEPDALLLSPVGAFQQPTYVASPPGDQDRLFVVQQGGVIRLVLDGVVQATPFLDVTNRVAAGGERGLFSIAFPPDYGTSGLFYIDYTTNDPANFGAMTVDEFHASDPNVADPLSRRNVITVPHPNQGNHNGGQLQFGPDGLLYIGTGDGGGGGDPFHSAQNLQDRRGKILRIDPRQDGGNPYRIPPNNPFVGRQNAYPEIWSYGLRNPWRFSFDRLTGDLSIGDVGQDQWEEIDYRPAGLGAGWGTNFGWSCYEGRAPYNNYNNCPPLIASPIRPVFVYQHGARGCSITGGYAVRDAELPQLAGRYVYADFCTGDIYSQILSIPNSQDDTFTGLNVQELSSFGEDACGHVYVMGLTSGNNVFRLRQTDPPPPDCQPAFQLPELTASVDDNFEIHLIYQGQELDGHTLPAGAYRLTIEDASIYHDFHLVGPHVSCVPESECETTVDGTGRETWTVNFTPGTVVYQCDPHAEYMHGAFRVTPGG